MRSMRYTDGRNREQTLTFPQWVYLDAAGRGFEQGWGGMRSTLVVRLLRERGLIMLDDRVSYAPWRVTGRTALGDQVIEQWRAKLDAALSLPIGGPIPLAAAVTLHKTAPWAKGADRRDSRLRRTYREWFAEHGGRCFKASAGHLNDPWKVEEIDRQGEWVALVAIAARNLPAVRQAIADTVAGMAEDEVSLRALFAPGAPTGRTAERNRQRAAKGTR